MSTYEEIMSKFTIQLAFAKQNNDVQTEREIINEMIKISNEKLSKRRAVVRVNYNRSKTYEKE